jgi:hypothetical protein
MSYSLCPHCVPAGRVRRRPSWLYAAASAAADRHRPPGHAGHTARRGRSSHRAPLRVRWPARARTRTWPANGPPHGDRPEVIDYVPNCNSIFSIEKIEQAHFQGRKAVTRIAPGASGLRPLFPQVIKKGRAILLRQIAYCLEYGHYLLLGRKIIPGSLTGHDVFSLCRAGALARRQGDTALPGRLVAV